MSIYSALFMFHHLENKIKDHKDFKDHKEISKIIYLKIIVRASLLENYCTVSKYLLASFNEGPSYNNFTILSSKVRNPRTKASKILKPWNIEVLKNELLELFKCLKFFGAEN